MAETMERVEESVGAGQGGTWLHELDPSMRHTRKVVIAAVEKFPMELRHASDSLKNDREVVLAAAKKYGWALEYASASLQDDPR